MTERSKHRARALVVAVDRTAAWGPCQDSDLPGIGRSVKHTAAALSECGIEVQVQHNPTGEALVEAFTDLVRAGRREGVPVIWSFVGPGATLPDGRLAVAGTDTDAKLARAVPLHDLAFVASTEGPQQIAVVLDCGFTGDPKSKVRSRTLTPNAELPKDRRVFRASDLVIAHPLEAVVADDSTLFGEGAPVGGVLYQISPAAGGGIIDIKHAGSRIGTLRSYGLFEPSAPAPFEQNTEYWFWRTTGTPWPDHFALSYNAGSPFGPTEPERYEAYPHARFGASQVVTTNPTGRCFRIERQPAGVLVGYLELVGAGPDTQNWYAVPGQIDLAGLYLFGDTERLEFTALTAPPPLVGMQMHKLTVQRLP
ncbi:MAG: hypothetical protein ABMA64_09670 [Myxococcota bacterium]